MSRMRLSLVVLVAVALLAVVAVPPAFTQPAFPPGLQQAIAAQERHTASLLAVPGVVGTAVGLGASGRPVVKIFTESPAARGLPNVLDGVPVVVEVTGPIVALNHRPGHSPPGGGGDVPAVDPTARFPRPVPIGVSTGHPDITAGTIGARVKDATGTTPNVYALSNNHVYANSNEAALGELALQPGPYDGGTDSDEIGTLDAFKPIDFTGGDNEIDAAIALSSPTLLGNATPSNGYGTPRSAPVAAFITQRVQKYGRTTGLTSGRVDAINATVNVGYGGSTARFVGQIVIRPGTFSAGGDSGSLIVVRGGPDDRKPVGLLFAGSLVVTIANPIDAVLNILKVTVDGN